MASELKTWANDKDARKAAAKEAKAAAKKESAAQFKELSKKADVAQKKADSSAKPEDHEAARVAHKEAFDHASSHYLRFGGLSMHDKGETHRQKALTAAMRRDDLKTRGKDAIEPKGQLSANTSTATQGGLFTSEGKAAVGNYTKPAGTQLGLFPGGAADDQPRDEQGRFASK